MKSALSFRRSLLYNSKLKISRVRLNNQSTSAKSGSSILNFPGAPTAPTTNNLQFVDSLPQKIWPIYRILDEKGVVENKKDFDNLELKPEELVDMYSAIVKLNTMDDILYNSQRQGRISFYMTNTGEEATQIGSAKGLLPTDEIYSQYREAGVLLFRGYEMEDFLAQCFGSDRDLGKGRQMPVHYGSKKLHFQTISSPLGVKIPQASGAGYGYRLDKLNKVCVCYFGDGAASEGDFHAGLNFASTLGSQTIFFCRNNGYAISTPTNEQYHGDGIVSRGIGYGIPSIRVDGNDVLAVYNVTRKARELSVKEGRPVLIEAMTYRIGHHSTSDDSTRYRSKEELKSWISDEKNPIARTRKHLISRNLWNDDQENVLREETKRLVLKVLSETEEQKPVGLEHMFEDVYDIKPPHILEQEKELHEHLAKYPEFYNNDKFKH
jgi:2-oxoisovalerate dehydrogenase E1 component alpha subunit